MERLRGVAVCSVIALAISGTLVATASAALPEFSEPSHKPFKFKGGNFVVEEAPESHVKLVCTSAAGTGEITEPKDGDVSLRLKGCIGHEEIFEAEAPCRTPGHPEGEIVTRPLAMTLGYIHKAKHEVGLALGPSGVTPILAEYECDKGFLQFIWEGSVIGKLTPVNKSVQTGSHFTLSFTKLEGRQNPTKLEGGPTDVLKGTVKEGEGGLPQGSELALSAKDTIAFTEAVEVKA